jgi:MFS family permease
MLRKFLVEPSIARKDFFIVFILLFNAIVWLYVTPIIIGNVLNRLNATYTQNFSVWATYYVVLIGSIIAGSILSKKTNRLTFLYLWIILGAVTSLSPALLNDFTMIHALIIAILLGVSSGLGIPSCWAYFADCTLVENRGRIGGIILLTSNLLAPLFVISYMMVNLIVGSIIFAVWRGSGLIIFFLKPDEKIASEMKKNDSFTLILRDKSFLLYFVAWFMFCLVDRLGQPILKSFFGDFHYLIVMIGPIIGGFSAFIGGLLSDRIGRKRILLYGFVTLGIAYAIISIVPATIVSWYFYLIVVSISTGILWVVFFLIVWGDLSQYGTREKYYVIGAIPLYLTNIIQLLSTPYITLIPETSVFSLASFFLFLAVMPLLYAPETLPEKKIRLRRLRKYVEAAKKVKEKYI